MLNRFLHFPMKLTLPLLVLLTTVPVRASAYQGYLTFLDFLTGSVQFDDSAPLEKGKPAAGNLIPHEIADFGSCSFFARRGVRWRQDFPDHSRLEVRCEPEPGSLLPGFHVWYRNTRGSRMEIGRCIFDGGLNDGRYYTRPGNPALVRVEWVNLDGGKNDGGRRRIEDGHFTSGAEPYADMVRWSFDAELGRLETSSEKYEYRMDSTIIPSHPIEPMDHYLGEMIPEFRVTYVKSLQN